MQALPDMLMIDTNKDVLSSPRRICPDHRKPLLEFSFSLRTPAYRYGLLPGLENLQYTGSFKVYNAIRYILAIDTLKRNTGGMAASSGNRDRTAASGPGMPGADGTIFYPENTLSLKVNLMELKDNP